MEGVGREVGDDKGSLLIVQRKRARGGERTQETEGKSEEKILIHSITSVRKWKKRE